VRQTGWLVPFTEVLVGVGFCCQGPARPRRSGQALVLYALAMAVNCCAGGAGCPGLRRP
jgi:hypothetical protein